MSIDIFTKTGKLSVTTARRLVKEAGGVRPAWSRFYRGQVSRDKFSRFCWDHYIEAR